MKEKVIEVFDNPVSTLGRFINIFILLLIYLSVLIFVIEARYQGIAEEYSNVIYILNRLILVIFSVELLLRLLSYNEPLKYITSFYGMVDFLAVVPELMFLFIGIPADTSWIRVVRILRLARVLKAVRTASVFGGMTGQLIPYMGLAVAFKGILVAFEGYGWWPVISNLNAVIGVVGFSLAVLLATKLNVINSRIYAIEDSVCRIVGAMRDMHTKIGVRESLFEWSVELERLLKSPKKEKINEFRQRTDALESTFEKEGVEGPNSAGFHRDVAYLLHRATARTPMAYELFLKQVVIAYIATVIIAVPGMTGFVAALLLVYVLGGAYILIDDMDRPLDFGPDSFITVNLEPISQFNSAKENYKNEPIT